MPARKTPPRATDGFVGFVEQLANRVIKPLNMVMLSRERIEETLDEAADNGKITRSDARELAAELVSRGRQETERVLSDFERLVGRGRQQIESATRRARQPVERLVRGGPDGQAALPIAGYDELTARGVAQQLDGLTPAQLRALREYERRRANRKSVLAAIDRALG